MAITDMDASAGGKASSLVRRKRAADRAALAEVINPVVEELRREEIGPAFLRMAFGLAGQASQAQVEVNSALEVKQLAEAAKTIHSMGRLELGESTSNQATFNVADAATRRAELQARLSALDADTTTAP